MAFLDIFNNNAFSHVELAGALDRMDYRPQRLGSLGIFTQNPVRTESIAIEERDNGLALIQTSSRGAPLEQATNTKRKIKNYNTVRIGKADRIMASELAFLREFGQEQQVVQLQSEIARRLGGNGSSLGLIDDMELTLEHMRLGAIMGVVLDANGDEIINWNDEFDGANRLATLDFNFATLIDGQLKVHLNKMIRAMMKLGKGAFTPQTRVHALCGDDFYDALTSNAEVRERYRNQQMAYDVPGSGIYETFTYGGVTFENYRGTDDGTTVAIGDNDCHFFPVNAPGVFMEVWSPGEKFAHINTLGQRSYADLIRDDKRDTYVDLELLSYPLHVCTRSSILRTGQKV